MEINQPQISQQQLQPAEVISDASNNVSTEDNTGLFLLLGVLAVYWYYKSTQKKNEAMAANFIADNSNKLDSYSKLVQSPYGARFESSFLRQRVKPNIYQIMKIDGFLQRLNNEQHRVLKKASQFETRTDIERALTQKEIQIYLPIRKKLLELKDNILN